MRTYIDTHISFVLFLCLYLPQNTKCYCLYLFEQRLLYSTLQVALTVDDINDNPPMFTNPTLMYGVSIPEDFVVDSCFLNISATDKDLSRQV